MELFIQLLDLLLCLPERVDLKLIHELAITVLIESALLKLWHRSLVSLELHHRVHLAVSLTRC